MKTANDLIQHCKNALVKNVQYVYGAKMEVLTSAQIKGLQAIYGSGYVWDSDIKKAGKMCCDCSGLISSCTGIVRNSTNYKDTALQKVTIAEVKKNWSNYVGWAFWLNGHIGVVSNKEGYYYAMDGSSSNMVHNPISKQKWVYALKLCDINYSCLVKSADSIVIKDLPVLVNGILQSVKAVNVDGYNYVKLRDVADVTKAFKVDYENGRVAIVM
ncbi:MAG: hypothetical protein MJ230_01595 [bacterium]|nr:hypothetical protein [bacterium]